MKMAYEIGNVYKKKRRYYICVEINPTLMLTCVRREFRVVRPHSHYACTRAVSCGELELLWDVSIEQIDEAVSAYWTPSTTRTRPRGIGRRSSGDDAQKGFLLRLHRFGARDGR